ncbi:MAG: MMPL family transporter, partial [Myxococcota bacterium]
MSELALFESKGRNRYASLWAQGVLRFRWPLLALICLLNAGAAFQAANGLKIDSSSEAMLGSGPEYNALRRLQNTFGQDRVFVVQIAGDVFTPTYLKRLRDLHADLKRIDFEREPTPDAFSRPGNAKLDVVDASIFSDAEGWGDESGGSLFEEVTSLINVRRTRWRDDAVSVEELMEPWPDAERLAALRGEVLSDQTLIGQVVNREGTHSAVALRATMMTPKDRNRLYREIKRITAQHTRADFEIVVAGFPALEADMFALLDGDVQRLFGLANLLIMVLLAIIFRHSLGVAGPMLVVFQSVLWTFALMAAFDAPITPVTSILSAFLICVGIGDSVHVLASYRDHLTAGLSNRQAIVSAIGSTGVPIFFTSATTMAGLLSFQMATLGSIRDLGLFGALGVLFALIHSVIFLPIVLAFSRRGLPPARRGKAGPSRIDRFLLVGERLAATRAPLFIGLAFMILAGYGISKIRVEHDPLVWLPDWTGLPASILSVDKHLGGSSTIQLMVTVPKGQQATSHEVLSGLARLERHVLDYIDPSDGQRVVVNVTSVLDAVRETSRAFNGNDEKYYSVPDTSRAISDLLTVFETSARDAHRRFVTVDNRVLLMTLRVRWLEASRYAPLKRHVDRGAQAFLPDDVDVVTTGSVYANLSICDAVLNDLKRSTMTALVCIAMIMLFLLRSIRLGLMAMVPNLFPVIGTYGFMGLVGIP